MPYKEKYSILYSDKAKRIDVCVEMWYNYRSKYWAGINMCKKKKQKSNDVIYYPVEDFSKSLAIPFEIGCDILEANIDLVTENEVLKSLPVIKYLVAAKDIGVSIYKGHQAKKLILFFQKLNQFIDDPSIQEMRKKILEDEKYLRKQAELALIILEKNIEIEKSHLIANVFYLYVKREISNNQYTELLLVINQIYMLDTQVLLKVFNGNPKEVEADDLAALNRLEGAGVISNRVIDEMGLRYNHYEMTLTGKNLVKVIKM